MCRRVRDAGVGLKMAQTDNPWTDADLAQLRALWVQEPRLSTPAIGRRMRRTKSGVVGKARRMNLPGRPSPINHGAGKTQRPKPLRESAATLPPMPVVTPLPPVVVRAVQPRPQVVAPPVSAEPAIVFKPRTGGACLFPLWPDHARPTHRYCGKPCAPDKHYCSEHQARCYTRSTWVPGVGRIVAEPAAS